MLALKVARRILQDDMFSGWGVRTLSADHPAYDPYSYHCGSVWPVEHGSFAMGMMRFGLIEELHTIARAMFEVSTLFDYNRLPECFSGHPRDPEHPFPALYPKTNWPQAWSAASLFSIVQAMLGIYPFAPMKTLLLDPELPDWLPQITFATSMSARPSSAFIFIERAIEPALMCSRNAAHCTFCGSQVHGL